MYVLTKNGISYCGLPGLTWAQAMGKALQMRIMFSADEWDIIKVD